MNAQEFVEFLSFTASLLFFAGLILFVYRIFNVWCFLISCLMLFGGAIMAFVSVIVGATNPWHLVVIGFVQLVMAVIAWLELLVLVKIDKERQPPF